MIHKAIMLCGNNNNKYPCEVLLTCIVRFLQKVLLRLHNLKI